MNLTVEQVEEILTTVEDEYGDGGWFLWDERVAWDCEPDGFSKPYEVEGLGSVQMANTYTGGEGGGESCEMVFQISQSDGGTRYFRKTGYYASYDGTHWDGDFSEVKPVEKLVTVYE